MALAPAGAFKFALHKQFIHGILTAARIHQRKAAAAHRQERQAQRRHRPELRKAQHDGQRQRQGGQHTEHDPKDLYPAIFLLKGLTAFFDHARYAVFRFEGDFLQKANLPAAGGADQKQEHARRHQNQQYAQAHAHGGLLGNTKAGRLLADRRQHQQRSRGQHAQQRRQRHFGRSLPP